MIRKVPRWFYDAAIAAQPLLRSHCCADIQPATKPARSAGTCRSKRRDFAPPLMAVRPVFLTTARAAAVAIPTRMPAARKPGSRTPSARRLGGGHGYFILFELWRLRRRTPGPPPFSSMNSTPAFSRASRILSPVRVRPPSSPSAASSHLTVGKEIPALDANYS